MRQSGTRMLPANSPEMNFGLQSFTVGGSSRGAPLLGAKVYGAIVLTKNDTRHVVHRSSLTDLRKNTMFDVYTNGVKSASWRFQNWKRQSKTVIPTLVLSIFEFLQTRHGRLTVPRAMQLLLNSHVLPPTKLLPQNATAVTTTSPKRSTRARRKPTRFQND